MNKVTQVGIIFFSIVLSFNTAFLPKVSALELLTTDKLALDTSILRETKYFKLPQRIVVIPIFLPDTGLKVTDTKWYRGIYYYTVERLGFSNIPFHYIVSSSGSVYAAGGSDERKIGIDGIGDDNVVVGYLASDKTSSSFNPNAETSLGNLLIDIANRNAIRLDNIYISGVQFFRDEITREVSIKSQGVYGDWNANLNKIIDTVRGNYNPVQKEYSIQVLAVNLPTEQVTAGQDVTATISLKNTGVNTVYGGTDFSIVATKVGGGNSMFYSNNNWISQSQFDILPDGQDLTPNSEGTYTFTLKTPLYLGEQTEAFELRTLLGQKIQSDNFNIKLNITKGSKKIIQINNTETNFLRVRNGPSTVADETGRVASGDRFFVLEEDPGGFLRIDLENGESGWVAGWLTTEIQ